MDFTTGLSTHLHRLSASIRLDDDAVHDNLDTALIAFTAGLQAAVPSYLGLQLRIVEHGHLVTFSAISTAQTAATSLQLPLAAIAPSFDPESRAVLYAAIPGAFVDLAADLSYALHLSTTHRSGGPAVRSGGDGHLDGRRRLGARLDAVQRIVLDADVPSSTLVSGVSGLYELSTINRAIGVLIDQGHHLDHAAETLRRDAGHEGIDVHLYAARLLDAARWRRSARSRCSTCGDA